MHSTRLGNFAIIGVTICIGAAVYLYIRRDGLGRLETIFSAAEQRFQGGGTSAPVLPTVVSEPSKVQPAVARSTELLSNISEAARPPTAAEVSVGAASEVRSDGDAAEQQMLRDQAEAKIDNQYRGFFAWLQAAGRDAERFRRMLVERELLAADFVATARAQGLDLRNPWIAGSAIDQMRKSQEEYTRQMQQALGDDYKEFLRWDVIAPERRAAEFFDRTLAVAGIPMNPSQANEFVQILYRSRDSNGQREVLPTGNPADGAVRRIE